MAAEVARRRGEGQKLRKEAAAVIGALEAALNKVRVSLTLTLTVTLTLTLTSTPTLTLTLTLTLTNPNPNPSCASMKSAMMLKNSSSE